MDKSPTAKRSPSILVTDVRSDQHPRGAPFAGAKQRSRFQNSQYRTSSSRFSNVSVSKILSNASEIPSTFRRTQSILPVYGDPAKPAAKKKSRTPLIQPLPVRTSKTSQKLVYIPDEIREEDESRDTPLQSEIGDIAKNKEDLSRVTAYLIADAIDLKKASMFLKRNHMVSSRLYDEVLYVPYQLPLLDGVHGYRVKSNAYTKDSVGRTNMDVYLDNSEQKDYHFEYYSGENVDSGTAESSNDAEPENYATDFKSQEEDSFDPHEPQYFNYKEPLPEAVSTITQATHAEVFLFAYGVIVFWNFSKTQEENILADLQFSRSSDDDEDDILIGDVSEQDYETEEFQFEFDESAKVPRIYNDLITLKSEDHLIKLTVSHAVAQSAKLSRFESRMREVLYSVSKLPKILALTGQLGLTREQLLKKSGKLFKLRVDVNLSSNVLDTPEFFWSFEPSLNPLYAASRDYLEIDERVEVINDRCKVFLEFTDVIAESIAENNMNKITWVIIVIIVISLMVSCIEIFVRYSILKRAR